MISMLFPQVMPQFIYRQMQQTRLCVHFLHFRLKYTSKAQTGICSCAAACTHHNVSWNCKMANKFNQVRNSSCPTVLQVPLIGQYCYLTHACCESHQLYSPVGCVLVVEPAVRMHAAKDTCFTGGASGPPGPTSCQGGICGWALPQ